MVGSKCQPIFRFAYILGRLLGYLPLPRNIKYNGVIACCIKDCHIRDLAKEFLIGAFFTKITQLTLSGDFVGAFKAKLALCNLAAGSRSRRDGAILFIRMCKGRPNDRHFLRSLNYPQRSLQVSPLRGASIVVIGPKFSGHLPLGDFYVTTKRLDIPGLPLIRTVLFLNEAYQARMIYGSRAFLNVVSRPCAEGSLTDTILMPPLSLGLFGYELMLLKINRFLALNSVGQAHFYGFDFYTTPELYPLSYMSEVKSRDNSTVLRDRLFQSLLAHDVDINFAFLSMYARNFPFKYDGPLSSYLKGAHDRFLSRLNAVWSEV